jgi:hypothetical protein
MHEQESNFTGVRMKRSYKILTLEGRIFGKWHVLGLVENDKPGAWYECKCECGNVKIIPANTLRAGRSTQCKDCHYASQYDPDLMLGRTFGKWKVVEFVDVKNKLQRFKCRCKCGNENIIYGSDLRSEHTTQCTICHNRKISRGNITHGFSNSSTYKIWRAMIDRCTNSNCSTYHYYGGRGIKVCERWLNFENFLKDMGPRPTKLTIDRIDNDGNYEPGNCRWVTHKENCNNRHRKK